MTNKDFEYELEQLMEALEEEEQSIRVLLKQLKDKLEAGQ